MTTGKVAKRRYKLPIYVDWELFVGFLYQSFDFCAKSVPLIILNFRFVDTGTMIEKIDECLERALGAIADYIMVHGRSALDTKIDRYFERINNPQNECDYFLRRKRIFRLNAAFNGNLKPLMQQGRIIDSKFVPI